MKSLIAVAALALAATLALSLSAQAQNGSLTRSFVSSSGADSNPCTITEPCASFAQAYTKVGANGVVKNYHWTGNIGGCSHYADALKAN